MTEDEHLLTPRQRAFLAANPDAELVGAVSEASNSSETPVENDVPNEAIKGVAGWLLVLVILLIAGTIMRLGKTLADIDMAEASNIGLAGSLAWETYKTQAWSLGLADLAVSLFAAFQLIWIRKSATVPLVIGCLWLLGPVRTVALFQMGQAGEDITTYVLVSCVMPIIWTAYLLRSRRVQNTYPATDLA